MSIFDFLKGRTQPQQAKSLLKIQGPKYLRANLSTPDPVLLKNLNIDPKCQWIGQLTSSSGNLFRIKYFGELMDNEIIISEEDMAQKVVIIPKNSAEQILLFDKSIHGWEGFICGACDAELLKERNPINLYHSTTGSDLFRIVFIAYYNEGNAEELLSEMDENHCVAINGKTMMIQDAYDDSFDALIIYAFDEDNNKYELINEELA